VEVVEGSKVNRAQAACLQTRRGLTTTHTDQVITQERTKKRSQSVLAVEAVLVCRVGHACAECAFLIIGDILAFVVQYLRVASMVDDFMHEAVWRKAQGVGSCHF
jgi:hypothetical protein